MLYDVQNGSNNVNCTILDETEEDAKPEETESDDDCLFCELGSGSEQITTDAFSEEIEDLSGGK